MPSDQWQFRLPAVARRSLSLIWGPVSKTRGFPSLARARFSWDRMRGLDSGSEAAVDRAMLHPGRPEGNGPLKIFLRRAGYGNLVSQPQKPPANQKGESFVQAVFNANE